MILSCRYYKGEEKSPYEEILHGNSKLSDEKHAVVQNRDMFWFYEKCWVHCQLNGGNESGNIEEYLAYGNVDFNDEDGTPLSLKALLWNRYYHFSWSPSDREAFYEFYNKYYSVTPTHKQVLKNRRKAFELDKVAMEKYHRLENDQLYFSTGGNTGTLEGRITPDKITELKDNEVFVFGSNASGHHHAGAAAYAMKKFGAEWGKGRGRQGQCYAISTMEGLVSAARNIKEFLRYAEKHQELRFYVTAIGCGIAGYTPIQIAPLFDKALVLPNVFLPESFWEYIWMTERCEPEFFEPMKEWKQWDKGWKE